MMGIMPDWYRGARSFHHVDERNHIYIRMCGSVVHLRIHSLLIDLKMDVDEKSKANDCCTTQNRLCECASFSCSSFFLFLFLYFLMPVRLLIINASTSTFPSSWFQWTYTERRQSIRPQDRSYCTLMVRTPTMLFVELSSRGRAAWMLSCARLRVCVCVCVGWKREAARRRRRRKCGIVQEKYRDRASTREKER